MAVCPPLAGFLLAVEAKILKQIFTGIKQRKAASRTTVDV